MVGGHEKTHMSLVFGPRSIVGHILKYHPPTLSSISLSVGLHDETTSTGSFEDETRLQQMPVTKLNDAAE